MTYQQAYYAANREKVRAQEKAWKDRNREKVLAQKKAYDTANAQKLVAAHRAWKAANREKERAAQQAWKARNPEKVAEHKSRRRARRRGAVTERIPAAAIKAIKAAPCTYCDAPGPSEVEHMIPLVRGGKHCLANLTSACGSCNRQKGTKTAEDFRAARRNFNHNATGVSK